MEVDYGDMKISEIDVKKEVMKKIIDGKVKMKHPSILLSQRIGMHCIRIVFLVAIVVVGIFFAKWVAGKF